MRWLVALLMVLGALLSPIGASASASASASAAGDSSVTTVAFVPGSNLPPAVATRVAALLQQAGALVHVNANPQITLACGHSSTAQALIPLATLAQMPAEAAVIVASADGSVLAADGNAASPQYALDVHNVTVGAVYACYGALQQLGFGFLHPLAPLVPSVLRNASAIAGFKQSESPAWPVRGFHVHSMHPLELTDLLNGLDITAAGNGSTYSETWDSMFPQWELYVEWAVANRLSRVEWVLLWGEDWIDFVYSTERQQRLAKLIAACKSFGLVPGADVPIALRQQHAWVLVNDTSSDAAAVASIQYHLRWLSAAGFSFISTESGFSEFTHGNDTSMLAWMNETARFADEELNGMRVLIKCHCSTGQICKDYVDPDTGLPLNFNFLPIYADSRMGIMPHTVQMYAFDDPAPTYGNQNFTYMFDFMFKNAQKNVREVVYHPETAYWVNYDIDVPLFLPYYALARLRDLRHIAGWQQATGSSIDGQMVFDSGWEYAYWMQDVLTARATWNPRTDIANDTEAMRVLIQDYVGAFLGDATFSSAFADAVLDLMNAQRDLLVLGKVPGQATPADVTKLNGIGYLEGWDTWADLGSLSPHALTTQPLRLLLKEMMLPEHSPKYSEVRPLLAAMNQSFSVLATRFQALVPMASADGAALVREIADVAQILANRAQQIYALYEGADLFGSTPEHRKAMLAVGRDLITQTAPIIERREAAFRAPVPRIAGWRQGPTVYHYGYLWTAHSLMYWWRDWAIASLYTIDALNPCYLNMIAPADVALGEGLALNATLLAEQVLDKLGYKDLGDCLGYPTAEPVYPADL